MGFAVLHAGLELQTRQICDVFLDFTVIKFAAFDPRIGTASVHQWMTIYHLRLQRGWQSRRDRAGSDHLHGSRNDGISYQ